MRSAGIQLPLSRRPIMDLMFCSTSSSASRLVALQPLTHAHMHTNATASSESRGMVGLGMIFDETYRPFFERRAQRPAVLAATLAWSTWSWPPSPARTGTRAERTWPPARRLGAVRELRRTRRRRPSCSPSGVDVVCVATPDDRHFEAARAALAAGKHVLIEKPSVLSLRELDELVDTRRANGRAGEGRLSQAADPDHKKLRTLVADGVLKHVNNGYCSLLEPKSISGGPVRRVDRRPQSRHLRRRALHQADRLHVRPGLVARSTVTATGQRGLVGPADGPTWDSVQLQVVYRHPDGREAAFDIHTSWVTPDNFPGYVEQEVQFRFDNGVWNAHQRKRGVELTVEGRTPGELKITPNYHYNGTFLEPWGERSQRGYGIEVIERFFREVAFVEFGGPAEARPSGSGRCGRSTYNDLAADRNCVAIVQALEAILARARPVARVRREGERTRTAAWCCTNPGTPHRVVASTQRAGERGVPPLKPNGRETTNPNQQVPVASPPSRTGEGRLDPRTRRLGPDRRSPRRGRDRWRSLHARRTRRGRAKSATSSGSRSTRPAPRSGRTRGTPSRSICNSNPLSRPRNSFTARRTTISRRFSRDGLFKDGPASRPPVAGHEPRRRSARATASRWFSWSTRSGCGPTATRLLLLRERRVACRTRSAAVPSGSVTGERPPLAARFSTRDEPQSNRPRVA